MPTPDDLLPTHNLATRYREGRSVLWVPEMGAFLAYFGLLFVPGATGYETIALVFGGFCHFARGGWWLICFHGHVVQRRREYTEVWLVVLSGAALIGGQVLFQEGPIPWGAAILTGLAALGFVIEAVLRTTHRWVCQA